MSLSPHINSPGNVGDGVVGAELGAALGDVDGLLLGAIYTFAHFDVVYTL